ncbi:MAG TPA: GFA family protein [Polyangiaceae bacterium]|jgi:hypothetical protein|nr:GFA family protein [Polyangiaceae bacterium]
MDANTGKQKKHLGTCHCGDVRFEAEIDATAGSRCNCSVCTKTSITGGVVKPAAFALLTDESKLSMYEWASKTQQRYFCKRCGVHCFGRGHLEQLGGDYVSVNLNCIDDIDLRDVSLIFWDGRHNNWQGGPRKEPWPLA